MGLMHLTCREASRLISRKMDRPLSFFERVALRMHMGICDACTRFSRQAEFLRRALQAYGGAEDPEDR